MRAKATSGIQLHSCRWLAVVLLPATLVAQPPPQSRLPVGFPGGTPVGMPTPPSPNLTRQAPQQQPSAATSASRLPAMPLATVPAPLTTPIQPTPANSPAQHATVRYADGLVTIQANNSSLNQILRSIMLKTGLQTTGGVNEDRVYGTLLINLLAGTGSNVIFVPGGPTRPARLFLSPRNGGSMPPSPEASANPALDADPVDTPASLAETPTSVPAAIAPAPAPTQPAAASSSPAQPAITTATPVLPPKPAPEPAKPKTAEQIVEEIMRRRAAQAQFSNEQKTTASPAVATPTATPATPETPPADAAK